MNQAKWVMKWRVCFHNKNILNFLNNDNLLIYLNFNSRKLFK